MSKLIQANFDGQAMQFNDDGWFNATAAAARYNKNTTFWLRQRDTVEYISALCAHKGISDFLEQFNKIKHLDGTSAASQAKLLRLVKQTGFVKTKSGSQEIGGGTWLHPKLAVVFARWLDVDFAIWCDEQIDIIIRGTPEQVNWKQTRHQAAVSFNVMCSMLEMSRKHDGKETEVHHYMNEARLVNWAFCGEFVSIDRTQLGAKDLDLLAKLEVQNTMMIARGVDREIRKSMLQEIAAAWRENQTKQLT